MHPLRQHFLSLFDTNALGRREQLDADAIPPALVNILTHLEQSVLRCAKSQLIGLGQQDMHGHFAGNRPIQHEDIELGQRLADVHHQHQPTQTFAAAQVGFEMLLPVQFQRDRHLGVAITRQVDQAALFVELEEVEQLGAPRRLRGARQAGVGQGIQGAGFTGVGAPGKGHFMAEILGALVNFGRADKESSLLAQADNGVLGLHLGIREGERRVALQARCPCDICAQPACCRIARQAASFPFQWRQYIMAQILCALSPAVG
ncbi:hypothetical protein PSEUDO8BK_30518 [Pseudomonas sp. 8BK]|nr:hypothetical protein PSEUDO8BK_30518 [Pseudomonas sp. 8BK]